MPAMASAGRALGAACADAAPDPIMPAMSRRTVARRIPTTRVFQAPRPQAKAGVWLLTWSRGRCRGDQAAQGALLPHHGHQGLGRPCARCSPTMSSSTPPTSGGGVVEGADAFLTFLARRDRRRGHRPSRPHARDRDHVTHDCHGRMGDGGHAPMAERHGDARLRPLSRDVREDRRAVAHQDHDVDAVARRHARRTAALSKGALTGWLPGRSDATTLAASPVHRVD